MFGLEGAAQIGIFGLGSVGLVSLLMFVMQKLTHPKRDSNIEKETKHTVKQEKLKDKLKINTEEQKKLVTTLNKAESAAETSKKKIKKIVEKATIEIEETLKHDSIVNIDKEIDNDWSNL